MNRIKFDSELMKLMALFESMTGAKVKDCINEEKLIFIVEENEMGKAIGKNGSNIKKIEAALKKKVKLVEFSSNPAMFVRSLIHPVEAANITQENKMILIHGKDMNSKAMIIGREHSNINQVNSIVKRYFDVIEVKVV